MTELRIAEHTFGQEVAIIEIWEDGQMIGAIYPKDRGVKIISKYLDSGNRDMVSLDAAFPPALHVNLWKGR
jgi:hypothetical protein